VRAAGVDTLAAMSPAPPSVASFAAVDRRAIADAVPLIVPAIPFGFVLGLAMTESEMPLGVAWSSSPLVFAGAAQLALVSLAGTASLWAVVAAALVINTRHVMYSAAMAPLFDGQPRWFRWLGPMVLIDQVFALASLRAGSNPTEFRRYYVTCGLLFFVSWQWITALGMVVGPVVPDSWRLEFAIPVMFLGLVVIGVTKRPQAVAAVVGGVVSLLAAGLQDRLGILVGALAGVTAGVVAETVWSADERAEARS
jgi:4-azaleucine resistance transporter AzlC